MKEKIKLGFIGMGGRGGSNRNVALLMEDVEIVAVCDEYEDRTLRSVNKIIEATGKTPFSSLNYKDVLAIEDMDGVVISTSWEMHVPIAVDAMKAGKYVAIEVGGAYSVEDCWRLVRTSEETGMPCMLLENCCYNREELMVLNMVRQGVFGEIVHCSGGYMHDLRNEIIIGEEKRHYRLRNYLNRNCDNYPTHQLGPICKILNINRGNRIISLNSVASKAAGMREHSLRLNGPDHELTKAEFAQGDIVTTILKCAHGETIVLQLDTTLPRPFYSRNFSVRGTKGMYNEDTKSVIVNDTFSIGDVAKVFRNNLEDFYEKYDHPLWREFVNRDTSSMELVHGGMDWFIMRSFIESVKNQTQPPITVYDSALWMSIGALSESSIARGGMTVDVPDFTGGKWIKQPPIVEGKYCLDKFYSDEADEV